MNVLSKHCFVNPVLNPPGRHTFERQMMSTMKRHLHPHQKKALLDFFQQSVSTTNPRQNFENLIDQGITNRIWGVEKAGHIKKNLLLLFPNFFQNTNINQIKSISQTDRVVCFYKNGPTGFLGNFAICPLGIQIWGHQFRCAEAAFQWKKYQLAAVQNGRPDLLRV